MKSGHDEFEDSLTDLEIEKLVESLGQEIRPYSSLRPAILSSIKRVTIDQIAHRKLSSFAITILLLIPMQPDIEQVSSKWRDANFFQPLRRVEEEIYLNKKVESDSTNWAAHDRFFKWRKNHVEQFARVMRGTQQKASPMTP